MNISRWQYYEIDANENNIKTEFIITLALPVYEFVPVLGARHDVQNVPLVIKQNKFNANK